MKIIDENTQHFYPHFGINFCYYDKEHGVSKKMLHMN